jgi:hypothetical protein
LEDISLETEISVTTFSRTHNFERAPFFGEVMALCKCYGISVQGFTDLVEKMKSDSSTLENFRNLRTLVKELRNKFCDTA